MSDRQGPEIAEGSAALVNAVGLHARPSVKLTQLARRFGCRVEIALSLAGPWVDAKSPVKVMRVTASLGAVLYVRTAGAAPGPAARAVLALIEDGFGETPIPSRKAVNG